MIRRPAPMFPFLHLGRLLAALVLTAVSAQAQTPDAEGLRQINGTRLWVAVHGDGDPLLVVHGGPGWDHRYLLPRLADLADEHRLVFYDQRASGRSSADVPPGSVSLEIFLQDLEGVREALGIERMHLLGHSFGGLLAMQYAVRHPERVRSLVLLNSTAASSEYAQQVGQIMRERLTPERQEQLLEVAQSEAMQRGEAAAIDEYMRILLAANFHDPQAVSRLPLYFGDDFSARSGLLQGLQADLAAYDLHDRLAVIHSPTLVVRGDSEALPRAATDRIVAAIPGARLVELEACGHFPFVECPDEMTAALRAFLRGLP